MFGRKKWIEGQGELISYQVLATSTNSSSMHSILEAQIVVRAEGIPPTPAKLRVRTGVPWMKLLEPGYLFDIYVDPADPARVKIRKDYARIISEIRDARASQEAAGMDAAAERAREISLGR